VEPPRSAPSLNRSARGKHRRQKRPPTQDSAGPKKRGRSVLQEAQQARRGGPGRDITFVVIGLAVGITGHVVPQDTLASPSVAQLARRLSARIVGPPTADRAAHPEVAEACLHPEQPDRFVYRQLPLVAADIRAAAIRRTLAGRDAPYRHGRVALPDALGQRDFARAWAHSLQARSCAAAGKNQARNVHRRLAPRVLDSPHCLHRMLGFRVPAPRRRPYPR
jgi:hypothetical protein